MAKVLKQGVFQREHKLCGSLIEFELKELKEDYHTDYLGDRDFYRYLLCSGCGEQMRFPLHGNL